MKTGSEPGAILSADERRKQTRDQIRSDILTIAREMMQADGVAALSLNGIARRLGMKPPSLYTYFDSKHAIYDALFRIGFEAFAAHMRDAFDQQMAQTGVEGGLEPFLRTMLLAYMNFAINNADLFQLMFQRPIPGFVPTDESLKVSFGALHEGQEQMRYILEHNNINTEMTIEQTRDLIISLIHGLTELHLANDPDKPIGEGRFSSLIDHAVAILVKAWSAD